MPKPPVKLSAEVLDARARARVLDLGDRAVEVVSSIGRVDLDNLHVEVPESGERAIYYGELAARAKRRASQMQHKKEVVEAQLRKKIRQRSADRAETISDQRVKDLVPLESEYSDAVEAWLTAVEAADVMESVKYTMARRHTHLTGEAISRLFVDEELSRRDPTTGPSRPQRTPINIPDRTQYRRS